MKIIFLDFDGVLNSIEFLATEPHRLNRLDPAAVGRLNAIIARSGAKVVVSSSWRVKRSVDDLRLLLTDLGFVGEVIDRTPEMAAGFMDPLAMRSREIQAWIDACAEPIESFVVLDDAILEDMAQNHVKTEFSTGLRDEHIDAALWILGEPAAV